MKIKRKHTKKNNRGQGMVEFALMLPVLLMVLLGIIEMGRLMFIYSSVATAARESARYGIAVGDNGSGTPRYFDCEGIRDAGLAIGRFAGLTADDIEITYGLPGDDPECGDPFDDNFNDDAIVFGTRMRITVTAYYTPIIPIVDIPSFPITSTAYRSIVKQIIVLEE